MAAARQSCILRALALLGTLRMTGSRGPKPIRLRHFELQRLDHRFQRPGRHRFPEFLAMRRPASSAAPQARSRSASRPR